MTIGERISEAAQYRGMNLHKLATLSGVSYNTLYSIVRRKSDRVDYDLISDIADALNISFGYFIGEEPIDSKEKHDRLKAAMIRRDFAEAERILGIPPGSMFTMDEKELEDFEKSKKEKEINLNRLKQDIHSKYTFFTETDFISVRDLVYSFHQLNDEGQRKAIERVEELAEIPKYQRYQAVIKDPDAEDQEESNEGSNPVEENS